MHRMQDADQRRRNSTVRRDAGLTLPELVVTLSVTSILLTAIAAALIAMLNISTQATTQLSEAKDVSFVQTRIPIDLGSGLAASDALSTADLAADLGAQLGAIGLALPSLDGLDGLPGSNVLTIVRPNTASPGNYLVIAYRYEQRGDDWIINRYEFRPGTAAPGPIANLVATELAAPPIPTIPVDPADPATPAWQPGDPVGFAANVSPQSLGNRPAGRDIQLTFASGRTFTTGGAGLSAAQSLPPANFPGLSDPLAPPSRCGKRIAIVVDTSGSVPQGSGGQDTETAAIQFIDGFVGTPTQISLNGFDQTGYGMAIAGVPGYPATRDQRAPYYTMLNDSAEIQGMKTRIAALDDTDGQWSNGKSTKLPGNPSNPRDPDGNGIFYGQVGDGTNWQGGLWSLYKNQQNQLYGSDLPDLVVFITDGQPNIVRTGPGTVAGRSEAVARDAAVATANEMRSQTGARLVGIMVGNKRTNSTYVGYLKDVIGPGTTEWNGVVGDGGNAETAGLFLGSFAELGDILRSIVIGECGGTVTLQKRVDDGASVVNPTSGLWKYTSSAGDDTGSRTLDRANASSVTFDYTFGPGGGTKTVQLSEEPVDGLVWDRADCTAAGAPLATAPNGDGTPGVTITVDANAAVSCLMISRPA